MLLVGSQSQTNFFVLFALPLELSEGPVLFLLIVEIFKIWQLCILK